MDIKRLISLSTALTHLAAAVDSRDPRDTFPYFFIVGAGVSTPDIPTASEIINHCKKRLAAQATDPSLTPAATYSHWFEQAYPHAIHRQRFIKELVDNAKVTPANLFLAHLLNNGKLGRLVVTPNFDNLLARALDLFGTSYRICDHPYTASRIDPQDNGVQIVHVHGSYQFYDIANLDEELASRRQTLDTAPVSISDLLARILWDRSPIVIGYGGWVDDVIMSTLERRLRSPLGRNLYWFCHNIDEIQERPSWLQDNANVYFVVSDGQLRAFPKHRDSVTSSTDDVARRDIGAMLNEARRTASESLEAATVLHELLGMYQIDPPEIIRSPINYLYEKVRAFVTDDLGKYTTAYSFDEVLARISRLRALEEASVKAPSDYLRFIDSTRRANSAEVINSALSLDVSILSVEQLNRVFNALQGSVASTKVATEAKTAALHLIDRIRGEIYSRNPSDATLMRYLKIRLGVADRLYRLGAFDDEISIYDDIISKYTDHRAHRIVALVCAACEYKANTLAFDLKRYNEAKTILNNALANYGEMSSSRVQVAVAGCYESLAGIAIEEDSDPAPIFQAIISRYKDSADSKLYGFVVRAYAQLGNLLHYHGKIDDAVRNYEMAIQYSQGKPRVAKDVARAYRNMCVAQLNADRLSHVIESASRAMSFLANASMRLRDASTFKARITYLNGRAQEGLGHNDEALQSYTYVINSEVDKLDPDAARDVASAYVSMVSILRRSGDTRRASDLASEAVKRFAFTDDASIGQLIATLTEGTATPRSVSTPTL